MLKLFHDKVSKIVTDNSCYTMFDMFSQIVPRFDPPGKNRSHRILLGLICFQQVTAF